MVHHEKGEQTKRQEKNQDAQAAKQAQVANAAGQSVELLAQRCG